MSVSAASRRALGAVAGTFAVNGAVYPSLLPRLPEIRDAVGAGEAVFGFALLGMGAGGLLGALVAPRLLALRGTAAGTTAAGALLAVAGVGPTLVDRPLGLFAVLLVIGLTDVVHDIGMNHLLMGVPTDGRSVASRMHALWSVSALAATGVGAAAAALGVPLTVHLAVVAVAGVLAQVVLRPGLARAGDLRPPSRAATEASSEGTRRAGLPTRGLVLLVGASIAVAYVEPVILEWSAITLRDGLGASVGIAGLGPVVLNATMVTGRLTGDRVIDALGAARTARLAGWWIAATTTAALVVALVTGSPWAALVGFAAAGLGAATSFPLLFVAGERMDTGATGRGASLVSGVSRVGMLTAAPLVGVVAESTTLVIAMFVIPLGGVANALLLGPALDRGGVHERR